MRPLALSIAGFDPSAGAGVLADIKTFESHGVYGVGVITANTVQNHAEFNEVNWIGVHQILAQIDILTKKYPVQFVKIGLVKNLKFLISIVQRLKNKLPNVNIIWDPILKSSSGFEFHHYINENDLVNLGRELSLITPNLIEIERLFPRLEPEKGAKYLSRFCPVLLKGGHTVGEPIDVLFCESRRTNISFGKRIDGKEKHGTGCVLSSAITANLAKGIDLLESCRLAKKYIVDYISSNNEPLGYHLQDYQLSGVN